ncbi:MAG TPA: DEAD/DEAH box helicase [Opitutaceae bacterium]
MLRLLLPPNLAAAAPRDAIAVKLELDLSKPPAPELVPALAILQRLGAKPAAIGFLQLTRAQLRELVVALRGQSVFFWVNAPTKPLLWVGPILRGVSEHVAEEPAARSQEPKAPSPESKPARSPGTQHSAQSSRLAATTPLTVDGSEHFLAITLPSRESLAYDAALELVKTNGFTLEPANRKWWLRDRHKVLNFLAAHSRALREEFHAEFTENFEKNTARLRPVEIAADAVEAIDGYNVTLALRAGRADEAHVLAAVAANRGYVESDGAIYLIDREKLERVTQAQQALAGEPGAGLATRRTHRVSAARLAEAQEILEEVAPHFQPPAEWRARSEALRHLERLQPAPSPEAFDALLRPYQRLGVAWLWHLHQHQLGGILADEMGLGKTLQALALLSAVQSRARSSELRAAQPGRSPVRSLDAPRVSLVVCPASLVENWRREAARFTPGLRSFVHHAEHRLADAAAFGTYDLVITSYATLARDRELFGEIEWACVIADEAQHIKNRRSQNAQALRTLRSRGRFLLTGTPLENSLEDLRSLFEFLMPGFLAKVPPGLRGDERAWYDERLRVQTAPYILRRTKQSVAPELPPKIEQTIFCEPTPAQAALYREVQERTERELFDLEAGGASENAMRLATLTQLLRLRQVCCDPRLLAADQAADSAKLEAFRELLDEALDEGRRMLVFSQFTSLLALVRAELEAQGVPYCYLDGSMPARARQAEVDRFQSSDEVPVFLLSLKAGGTGLNLTGADVVVHYDPWWNPAVEAQATDRAHRIGQTRVVTSYKLIVSGTVEEKVLALQDTKRALLADVFEASDAAAAKLSLADLRGLLRA